jgi:DNA-directed RNA polymerase subunit RPC12/RpoP
MGEEKVGSPKMRGVKITRPGSSYYFDDAAPTCPMCGGSELEARCRVRTKPRTAEFKCLTCRCKFEKTRVVETEPEGYALEARAVGQPGITGSCPDCGSRYNLGIEEIVASDKITCPNCGFVIKSRTSKQGVA